MNELVDGKKIADEILRDLKGRVAALKAAGRVPRLIVFLVGRAAASLSYIRVKQKRAQDIGLEFKLLTYPESVSPEELQSEIRNFGGKPGVAGILVQLPLPPAWPRQEVLDTIDPALDVDSLTTVNQQRLVGGNALFLPPAPAAVIKILEFCKVNLENEQVLLVGSGDLVGKPLAAMLLNQGINFHLANRHTENLEELARRASVIITGVGKPGLITGSMIREGAVVIDAGTAESDAGDLQGDVDAGSVAGKARFLAAVPGGVGPVTVAMLLQNVVAAAENLTGKQ